MTDQELVQKLIARDEKVSREFFFDSCRPLFNSIIRKVYDFEVDYDEIVSELYLYLMEDDAAKLRGFQFRSTLYQWIKVVAIRYFVNKKDRVIEDVSHEPPIDMQQKLKADEWDESAADDIQRLFAMMPNKRYCHVLQRLLLDECTNEQLALEMNITKANLYNIKRRAMAQLSQVAINEIREYGRK